MNTGTVIKSTGSNYIVKYGNKTINCKIRGKFRTENLRTTNPIAAGDIVDFKIQKDHTGVITNIHERKNFLTRKSTNLSKQTHIIAANIDIAILVAAIINPVTYPVFIDRWLIACENRNITPVIIFNKTDLYNTKELKSKLKKYIETYSNAGYKCLKVSAETNYGINDLKKLINNKITVISGNSGVGKSSIINALEPNLNLKTKKISEYHKQGKHTTTFAEMFPVAGGYIIDTPGIKSFGLDKEIKKHLHLYFPEFKKFAKQCRFGNCTHTNEPDCAVKKAVNNDKISKLRYNNYINILSGEENKYRQDKYL